MLQGLAVDGSVWLGCSASLCVCLECQATECVSLLLLLLQVPGARLALVGDGPQRAELEQIFKGMPVKFMVSNQTPACAPDNALCRASAVLACVNSWLLVLHTLAPGIPALLRLTGAVPFLPRSHPPRLSCRA